MHAALGPYSALAVAALILHALFILWVVFGAFVTRSRPILRWLHVGSLNLGNLYGAASLAMPSDGARELARGKARVEPYQGGFLLHHLDKLVYPDISPTTLT